MLFYNISAGYKPVFFGTDAIFCYVCAPFCSVFDQFRSLIFEITSSFSLLPRLDPNSKL